MIYTAIEKHIQLAAKRIQEGGLVVFPTETVYGLGANAFDENAVRKIFEVKKRPADNPLIVHIASANEIGMIAWVPEDVQDDPLFKKLFSFWPGPLTLVLPVKSSVSSVVTGGKNSIAVRVPRHPVALELLKTAQVPIAAPSANISSRISATTAAHVEETLGNNVDMIIDGGPCEVGVESTILSLLEWPPRILRPGGISAERISKLLDVPCSLADSEALDGNPKDICAPGMLKEHYAPKTKMLFRSSVDRSKIPERVGLLSFGPSYGPLNDIPYRTKMVLSETGNLHEVANRLFSALYEMDKLRLDLILVDECEEAGIGRAIMDRLRRAVAKFA